MNFIPGRGCITPEQLKREAEAAAAGVPLPEAPAHDADVEDAAMLAMQMQGDDEGDYEGFSDTDR